MTPLASLRVSLFLIASVCICDAQDAKITTTTFTVPGKHGKPDIRCERTYRGKICVLMTMSEKRPSGDFVPYARSFSVGDAFFCESDEDRDGFFETVALSGCAKDGTALEVFIRARDGSLQAIPHQQLDKFKEMSAAMVKFWNEALPPK